MLTEKEVVAVELDSRKQKILKAIIEEYTITGEPVGSKRVSALLDVSVSSATIRNEMAALFELGALEQPYTSAGRIPSHMGYRYYIDRLMQPIPVSDWDKAEIQAMFNVGNPDPDRLLSDAAQALANYTRCATISSTSTPATICVKRVELIPVAERTVIILVIATNGVIKSKVCRVEFQVNRNVCEFFTSFANSRLADVSLGEISSTYINSVAFSLGDYTGMFTPLLSSIYELCKEINDGQFYTRGETNLLTYNEMKDMAGDLLILLTRKDEVLGIIPSGSADILVRVGKENNKMELSSSSVVFAKYDIAGLRSGVIGLVGPVRLKYSQLIPHMTYFAKTLGELLSATFSEQN